MITTKKKIAAIFVFLLLGILAAAFELFEPKEPDETVHIESISELSGQTLGGIISRMPDTSAKIFFESLLGIRLSGYSSCKNMDELLFLLKTRKVSAVGVSDITASWLLRTQDGLKELKMPKSEKERFWFALALKPEQKELRDRMEEALQELKENGGLDQLTAAYLTVPEEPEPLYPKDMKVNSKEFSAQSTIFIGVTGATPPIDMLDEENQPYGFCVALMDEIGQAIGTKVEFIVLSNDAAFSNLMSGRVDALFCWGSGPSTMDPGAIDKKKEYITTEGYYPMYQYAFLTLE